MLISVRMNVNTIREQCMMQFTDPLGLFCELSWCKNVFGKKTKTKTVHIHWITLHKDFRFSTTIKGNIHKASHRVLWLVLRPLGNLSEAILWTKQTGSRKHQNHKVFIQYIMPKHSFTYYGKSGVYSIGILRFWPYNHNICYKSTIFTFSGAILTNYSCWQKKKIINSNRN